MTQSARAPASAASSLPDESGPLGASGRAPSASVEPSVFLPASLEDMAPSGVPDEEEPREDDDPAGEGEAGNGEPHPPRTTRPPAIHEAWTRIGSGYTPPAE